MPRPGVPTAGRPTRRSRRPVGAFAAFRSRSPRVRRGPDRTPARRTPHLAGTGTVSARARPAVVGLGGRRHGDERRTRDQSATSVPAADRARRPRHDGRGPASPRRPGTGPVYTGSYLALRLLFGEAIRKECALY